MQGKKQASEGRRSSAHSARKPLGKDARPDPAAYSDMNADDIEDELRDVVFDYENSQALVLAADDFLNDRKPTYKDENQSVSGKSGTSVQRSLRRPSRAVTPTRTALAMNTNT